MRQILFRGLEKPSQMVLDMGYKPKMVYGTGIFFDGINTWLYSHDESAMELTEFKTHIIDKDTLGQFTGLLDKNGKEIYEWDRVKVVIIWNELNHNVKREFVSSIIFCEHRGCYIFPDYHNVSVDDAREGDEMISLEVIGNIHEATK